MQSPVAQPSARALGHYFRGVGIPIYEGYGLTETSAAITVNTSSAQRVGTVGKPINGHAARIAEDGELLLQGPVVFAGYWHNEKATAESIVDGWFHTGDLGSIDNEGLRLHHRTQEGNHRHRGRQERRTGRPRRFPARARSDQPVPRRRRRSARSIGALITLDPETLPGWVERNGLPAGTPDLPIW